MNDMQDVLGHRIGGSFKNVLLLFIHKAIDIAKDSRMLSETFDFAVRP